MVILPQNEVDILTSNIVVNKMICQAYVSVMLRDTLSKLPQEALDKITTEAFSKLKVGAIMKQSGVAPHEMFVGETWAQTIRPHLNDFILNEVISPTLTRVKNKDESLKKLKNMYDGLDMAHMDFFNNSMYTLRSLPQYLSERWYDFNGLDDQSKQKQAFRQFVQKDNERISGSDREVLNNFVFDYLFYKDEQNLRTLFENFKSATLADEAGFNAVAKYMARIEGAANVTSTTTTVSKVTPVNENQDIPEVVMNTQAQFVSVETPTQSNGIIAENPPFNPNMDNLTELNTVEEVTQENQEVLGDVDLPDMSGYFQQKEIQVSDEFVLNQDNDKFGLRRMLYSNFAKEEGLETELNLDWDGSFVNGQYTPGFYDFVSPFLDGTSDVKAAKRAFNDLQKSPYKLKLKDLDGAIDIMYYVNNLGHAINIGDTSGLMANGKDWKLDINFQATGARAQVPILHTNPTRMGVYEDYEHKMEIDQSSIRKLQKNVLDGMTSGEKFELRYSNYDMASPYALALSNVDRTKLLIGYANGAAEININGAIYTPRMHNLGAVRNATSILNFYNENGQYVPIMINDKDGIKNQVIIPTKERAEEVLRDLIDEGRLTYEKNFDRELMDQFVYEWARKGLEDKLNPNKNEELNAYLSDSKTISDDQLRYIRTSAMLHDMAVTFSLEKDRYVDENGVLLEGKEEAFAKFMNDINQKVDQYIGNYPELKEKYVFGLETFNTTIDVDRLLEEEYQSIIDARIGNFEDGFNASLINGLIGYETTRYLSVVDRSGNSSSENNPMPTKKYLMNEAIRVSGYSVEKLLGDDFNNEQTVDDSISFDASNARSKTDLSSEEDAFLLSIMQLIEDELQTISTKVVNSGERGKRANGIPEDVYQLSEKELNNYNGSGWFLPKNTDSDNPYNIRIDDKGVIRWEGVRQGVAKRKEYDEKGNPTDKNVFEIRTMDVYGEIGQVFAKDKNGIVHTNFKGKENYSFAPGYHAYYVMDQSVINPEDNLRLHSFDKQMRDTVRALVREQFTSQFMTYSVDGVDEFRLRLANKQSALNRMLYSNKTIGVYGEKLEPHSLDYEAQNKPNVASMSTEMLDAKAKTFTQRIHFNNNFIKDSNSQAYEKYQNALMALMKPEYALKDERSRYIVQDSTFVNDFNEKHPGILSSRQVEFLNTVLANDRRLIMESIIDKDRQNELIAKIQAHDTENLFSQMAIQEFIATGRAMLMDMDLQGTDDKAIERKMKLENNLRMATTPALRANGYQSSRITAQDTTAGLLDPYATGQGDSQGKVRYLADGVSVDPDTGQLIKENDEERTNIMSLPMFANSQYDPFIRQVLSTSAFMHALGVDEDTHVMYSPFYGHNFNDAMVVSKNFAERNMVPDDDGVYRPLTEGDKISDTHGNKGVISLVIDPDWTEEQAKELNLYKEWKWFNVNPTLDVVASSFAPVSRKNAGIFHEGLNNGASDLVVPFDNDGTEVSDKTLDKGMFKMSMMILKQTADTQTKLYEAPGEGRKFSGQGTWVAQAIGADELVEAVFTKQAQNKDFMNFREYLLVLGMDVDDNMQFKGQYTPHEGEQRKVFEITPFTDKTELMDVFSKSGGILKLPFEIESFSLGESEPKMTDEVFILPPHLRQDVTFDDEGTTTRHEYSKYYSDIIQSTIKYVQEEYDSNFADINERTINAQSDPELREFLQEKLNKHRDSLEEYRKDVALDVQRLQTSLYNRVFDPDSNGKHGYLREVVGRKSVDRSATAVMTPDPRLDINQVRIGKEMAKRLNVKEGDKIITWRDPLIKTGGMRMVEVTIGENTGVAVNPTAPGPMGGDFDGDNLALMAVPKVSKDKAEQQAFVDRMYRKFSYEANLIDYGAGMEDGKYALYLESKGMDIATAEKVFKENPEKFSKALEAKAVIDELLSDTLHVPVGENEVMTVKNDRRTVEKLFESNDAFYQGFKDKYMNAVNTFYHEAFANGYHTDHTYQAISREQFEKTTRNIVDDKCKGKPVDVGDLMNIHYDADTNATEYKAYQREGQLATAVKTDSTGRAGAVAQKLIMLARSNDHLTNKLFSSLEASERFTQAVVSLKNNGPIAEKVSNALSDFSSLLKYPTVSTYERIRDSKYTENRSYYSSIDKDTFQNDAKSQYDDLVNQAKAAIENGTADAFDKFIVDTEFNFNVDAGNNKPLMVKHLRGCMKDLYVNRLDVSLADEDLNQVCLLLTDACSEDTSTESVVQLLDLAQGVHFDPNQYIDDEVLASLPDDEKENYRQSQVEKAVQENQQVMKKAQQIFDTLPVIGLDQRMASSSNLFDQIQYRPSKEILKDAVEKNTKLNGASHAVAEILPNNMENVYAKSTQMPEITPNLKDAVVGLQAVGAKAAIDLKETLLDRLDENPNYKKSELLTDLVEAMYYYQNDVQSFVEDIKRDDPLAYQQLNSVPFFSSVRDMSTYEDRMNAVKLERAAKDPEKKEVELYKSLVRPNDRAIHEFAEYLIKDGQPSNEYLYEYEKTSKSYKLNTYDHVIELTNRTHKVARVADTNADVLVDRQKVEELFEHWVADGVEDDVNRLEKVANAQPIFNMMFGRMDDGYGGELLESQYDVLCDIEDERMAEAQEAYEDAQFIENIESSNVETIDEVEQMANSYDDLDL